MELILISAEIGHIMFYAILRQRQQFMLTRITIDPAQMGGVPCIRGLRIPVATVIGMLADGMTHPEILEAYPDLEEADISEALHYAAESVREQMLPIVPYEVSH